LTARTALGFTGGQEGFDRLDGVLVFIEIPHPAVAARIEDGVGVFLLDALKANDSVKLSFRSDVLFRSDRKVSSEFRFAEQWGPKWRRMVSSTTAALEDEQYTAMLSGDTEKPYRR
jgi:hypothetical protein